MISGRRCWARGEGVLSGLDCVIWGDFGEMGCDLPSVGRKGMGRVVWQLGIV